MGRIENGAVSGTLPEPVGFAVNYPGYPASVAAAVRTLGGMDGLEKARALESNYLEMKFRPDDPFAHPAFGELRRSSDLVLRLSKRRASTSGVQEAGDSRNKTAQLKPPQSDLEAEIVAKVEHTYSFEGMADYQHVLAVSATAKRNRANEQLSAKENPLSDPDHNETMMLIPPLFSLKDIPEEIFLRKSGVQKRKSVPALDDDNERQTFALGFKIKEVPKVGNWEVQLHRGSEAWLRTAALVRLFQERPVWTKSMLTVCLVEQNIIVTDYYLKILLARIAYYFVSGPFRLLWIRNGYDPRSDPESRAYQIIDFRVPISLRAEVAEKKNSNWGFADICGFKAIPQRKFTQFQMIDLQDDDIQAQIEQPAEQGFCSEGTGWFRQHTIQRLRQIVRVRFLGLYPGASARALETMERRNLERYKFVQKKPETGVGTNDDDGRVEEGVENDFGSGPDVGGSALGKEDGSSASFSEVGLNQMGLDANGEEEEEEEDEEEFDQLDENELRGHEEDEEEEEEMEEAVDGLPLQHGVEDSGMEFIDPADNIPKNYLQALLGKFSFNGGENGASPALDGDDDDDDDGGFAIYEEDDEEDEDD